MQVLDETVVVNHSDDMFAPVGLLRVMKCHTEPKTPITVPASVVAAAGASTPGKGSAQESKVGERDRDAVDPQGVTAEAAGGGVDSSRAVEAVDGSAPSGNRTKERQDTATSDSSSPSLRCLPHVHESSGGLVYLSGIRTPRRTGEVTAAVPAAVAARQTARCLAAALAGLEGVGVSFRDVCFVHLYLRDMRHFSAVNEEYCK